MEESEDKCKTSLYGFSAIRTRKNRVGFSCQLLSCKISEVLHFLVGARSDPRAGILYYTIFLWLSQSSVTALIIAFDGNFGQDLTFIRKSHFCRTTRSAEIGRVDRLVSKTTLYKIGKQSRK